MLKMELVVLVVCVIPVVTCRRVTPKSPPPECGYAYCSSEEFCDDVMGTCTGCDMICQPDVMDPECQKQCPGFTLQTVNASPKKDSTGKFVHPSRIDDEEPEAAFDISQTGRQIPPNQSPGDPVPLGLPSQEHEGPTGHPLIILMVSLAGAVVVALVATLGLLYYKRESCRTSRYGRAPTRDTTHPGQGSVNVENGTAGGDHDVTGLTTNDVTGDNTRDNAILEGTHETDGAASSQTEEKTLTCDRRHDNYLSAKGHQVVQPTDDQPMVPTES